MPVDPVTGIIGAGLNYLSSSETNATNIQMAREANRANRDIAREQNEWNLMMWQMQNAYNDPSAQMARLKAAGINPALAYAQGGMMNEAAPAQEAAGAHMGAARIDPYYTDPLMMAQIANINANTQKVQSETKYQDYMNAVEEALANSPISSVTVVSPDGSEETQIEYGNIRVEMTKAERKALNLNNNLTTADFAALVYNIALLTGSDSYALSPLYQVPSETPGYEDARAALKGNQDVQKASGQLAQIGLDAAKAEKAGRQAYADWLKEHEDDPAVKFALTLQGFLQTFGISLPRLGGSTMTQGHYDASGSYIPRTSRSWFFGSR